MDILPSLLMMRMKLKFKFSTEICAIIMPKKEYFLVQQSTLHPFCVFVLFCCGCVIVCRQFVSFFFIDRSVGLTMKPKNVFVNLI